VKRWIPYVLLGMSFFVVFLLIQIPAVVGVSLIESFAKDTPLRQLRFYGVSGTIWNGQAKQIVSAGQQFNSVSWNIHPGSLLLGRGSATISFKSDGNRFSARISQSLLGTTILEGLEAKYQMQDLIKLMQIPAVKLGGQINLRLDELVFSDGTINSATGGVFWSRASSEFPQKVDLGDLKATLDNTDDGVKAVLRDGGGPLELNAELLLAEDGQFQLSGMMAAREGQGSSLANSLRMMGKPNPQGKIVLKNSGNLSDFGFLLK